MYQWETPLPLVEMLHPDRLLDTDMGKSLCWLWNHLSHHRSKREEWDCFYKMMMRTIPGCRWLSMPEMLEDWIFCCNKSHWPDPQHDNWGWGKSELAKSSKIMWHECTKILKYAILHENILYITFGIAIFVQYLWTLGYFSYYFCVIGNLDFLFF